MTPVLRQGLPTLFPRGIARVAPAAAVAALMTGRYTPAPDEVVVAIVCGMGTDGIA